MRITRLLLAGLLLLTLLVLIVQNMLIIELRFIIWELPLPVAFPVVAAYLLGAWSGASLWAFLKREREELHA